MNGGRVQRVFAVPYPQEARALLKGFRPQLGHLFQLCPAGNAVFFPVSHDIFSQRGADARHMGQQRRRCGGKLHTHAVDASFHHAVQRFLQLALLQVVLILPHADGLGVDLDQLRQRVLHPAGNADRAAQADVKLGKLLSGQLAGGINGRSRLADDHIRRLTAQFRQKTGNELLRLAAGGSVPDGDGRHAIFAAHGQNFGLGPGLRRFLARKGKVPHAGSQHLAVFIHDSQLAAGTEARVNTQRHLALDRRRHQELMQILAEHLNRGRSGPVGQLCPDFPLQTGLDEPFPCIQTGRLHLLRGRAAFPHKCPFQNAHGSRLVHMDADLQEFLPLATIDRQNPMAGEAAHLLRKVIIHAVNAVFVLGLFGFQHAGAEGQLPQLFAGVRVVAELLGQNIPCALQSFFSVFNAPLRIDESLRDFFCCLFLFVLHQQLQGQRLQPLFLGNGSAGAALGTEGPVQVFQFGQRRGRRQLGGKLLRQVSLLLQGVFDFRPALVQSAKILQAFKNLPQHLIVQRIGHCLTVEGNKRNGISIIDQLEHILALLFFQMKLLTKKGGNIHWFKSFPYI